MLLCIIFLLGAALSAPTDDVQSFINEAGFDSLAELTLNDETFLMHIVPSGMMTKKMKNFKTHLSDLVSEDNSHYQQFMTYVEKGYASKGLTFNIYDDNMRDATIALYRMLRDIDKENIKRVEDWAKLNINDHMFDYAERLYWLFSLNGEDFGKNAQEPPFLFKPNFFVNGETIIKALKIRNNIHHFHYQDAKVNQFYRTDDIISINTNYSGWNKPQDGCEERLDYFTEDISLNSYYYGVHLSHPYWMSNNELDEINLRHTEQYYFKHQQLLARFQLEEENLKQRNITRKEICDNGYNSYLIYDNGLPFPIRNNIQGDWTENKAKLQATDIAIRECLDRALIMMDNGTIINLTEENHIYLITKLIRANYEGLETAKIVRSLYGYGKNGYPTDQYNPAPSLLHSPETTVRDPAFWYMVQFMLKYYSDFQINIDPFDVSQYETDKFVITDSNFTRLTTYFEYYQFIIDKALQSNNDLPVSFTARQKRLNFMAFTLNFTVMSKVRENIIVRLFLGPPCNEEDCWNRFGKFFQIDYYIDHIEPGKNVISWAPSVSNQLSSDEVFNKENNIIPHNDRSKYNMYKFPKNLLLPKGLQEGLNLTLFVMLTPLDSTQQKYMAKGSTNYDFLCFELEDKPLGFPFHRQSLFYKAAANNYRFYNISVFHKKRLVDGSGYFSPHLY